MSIRRRNRRTSRIFAALSGPSQDILRSSPGHPGRAERLVRRKSRSETQNRSRSGQSGRRHQSRRREFHRRRHQRRHRHHSSRGQSTDPRHRPPPLARTRPTLRYRQPLRLSPPAIAKGPAARRLTQSQIKWKPSASAARNISAPSASMLARSRAFWPPSSETGPPATQRIRTHLPPGYRMEIGGEKAKQQCWIRQSGAC